MVVRFRRYYEGMNKNPEFSLRYVGNNKYNVFREIGDRELGDYNRSELIDAGFSNAQLDYLKKNRGTVNFVRDNRPILLRKSVYKDRFQRPIYKDSDGRVYVDTELGDKKIPDIHTVSKDGEPIRRVIGFRII